MSDTEPAVAIRTPHDRIPPKVASGLVIAQAHVTAVEKDKRNDHHRYKYASAEDLMVEAHRVCAAAKLAFVGLGWELANADTIVRQRWMLVHESGDSWGPIEATMPVLPGQGRPLDKALATALTYLEGYVRRTVLGIPRVDESEEVDQRRDHPQTRRPPQTPPAAPANRGQARASGEVRVKQQGPLDPLREEARGLLKRVVESDIRTKERIWEELGLVDGVPLDEDQLIRLRQHLTELLEDDAKRKAEVKADENTSEAPAPEQKRGRR